MASYNIAFETAKDASLQHDSWETPVERDRAACARRSHVLSGQSRTWTSCFTFMPRDSQRIVETCLSTVIQIASGNKDWVYP